MAAGTWLDLSDIPATAHLIGGCAIGATAADGVIDCYHRVHGYPGLHVPGGTAVSANLGMKPAPTITRMAERAMALWPNRGEAGPQPAQCEPYRRIDPVPPRHPVAPGRPESRDR
ncbi:MAG: GMC oxidoreductase [Streptosporangiaceae bacterium]